MLDIILIPVIPYKRVQINLSLSSDVPSGYLFGIIIFQVLDENNVENGNINTFKNAEGEEKEEAKSDVKYGIDDIPPWYLCILMGLQVIWLYNTTYNQKFPGLDFYGQNN
jgi:hypothetical protein